MRGDHPINWRAGFFRGTICLSVIPAILILIGLGWLAYSEYALLVITPAEQAETAIDKKVAATKGGVASLSTDALTHILEIETAGENAKTDRLQVAKMQAENGWVLFGIGAAVIAFIWASYAALNWIISGFIARPVQKADQ